MTIETYKGKRYVFCDDCSEELKDRKGQTALFDPEDFDILIEALQDAGWKSSKNGKVWEHFCPDCQE